MTVLPIDGYSNAWQPKPNIRHEVTSAGGFDRLNETGSIAIDLLPVSSRRNSDIILQGAQGRTFCCWMTNSISGFVSVPKHEADVLTIRFIESGSLVRHNSRHRHIGLPSTAMLLEFRDMQSEEASVGFRSFGGSISREALIRGARALGGIDNPVPRFSPVASISTPAMSAFANSFRSLIDRLSAGIDMDDLWLALMEEVLIYQLLTAWPKQTESFVPRNELGTAQDRMAKALDFIEANLSKPIRLEDVANAAGVSVRTLQASFRKSKSCSPIQYLLGRRLDQVRSDLQTTYRDEIDIAEAAKRWGFSHMGEFSRRYKEHFGYLPRETRRKPYR